MVRLLTKPTIIKYSLKKPSRVIIETVLKNSCSNTFEEACQEWVLIDVLRDDDEDFVSHCEICGHMFRRENIVIHNELTNETLKIGRECIKRFSGLKGISNREDIEKHLGNFENSHKLVWELQGLWQSVLDKPTQRELLRFNQLAKKYLGNIHGAINGSKMDGLKKKLMGLNPSEDDQSRLIDAIWNPKSISVIKISYKHEEIKEYDSQKMKAKKTRIETSLSSSKDYKNDQLRNIPLEPRVEKRPLR